MKNTVTLAVLCLLLFNTSSLKAEDQLKPKKKPSGSTSVEVRFLPEVVVIGSKEAVSQLPSSGDFINRNEIRMHSYDNVHQALRKTTGVYVQEETGLGLLANISLRGVDSHRSQKITIMEDGIPTAPAPYSAPSAYYTPTMGRMSGLEVLKGTSQVKYGPHTTGGAINYLSTPVPGDSMGYLKMLYGSFNESRAHAYYGGTTKTDYGRIGGLVEIYHRQMDGFKTIKHSSGDDDETGFNKTDYMGKLIWELEDALNQRLELKVGYTDFEADETYLGLSESDFANNPYQRYYASRLDNFQGEHLRTYLKHYMELSGSTKVTSAIYYHNFHRNWYKLNDIKDVEGLPAGAISMAEALASGGLALATLRGENAGIWRVRANNRDYYLWGAQSMLQKDFDAIGAKHELELGIRYHTDEAKRFQWQDELSIDNSGDVVSTSYGAKGLAGNRVQKANAIAVFAQDDMTWDRLTVIPGIRAEYIDNEVTDYKAGTGTKTGAENALAGGISAKYKLNDEALLFTGVYRGYSVPSANDSINKNLKEETSVSGEIGARYGREGVTAQLSGFYTHLEDLIVGGYVGTASDTDAENVGNVNSYGAELKLEMDMGILKNWSFQNPIWVACTYTQAKLDGNVASSDPSSIFAGGKDGNDVPYIPDYIASVGYGLSFNKLDWEITATYVDSTYSTANNSTEQINSVTGEADSRFGKVDSRVVVSTSAHYALLDNLSLFLNVHNLFDEEYMASRHPYGPRPGKPLTAMAGVEVSF